MNSVGKQQVTSPLFCISSSNGLSHWCAYYHVWWYGKATGLNNATCWWYCLLQLGHLSEWCPYQDSARDGPWSPVSEWTWAELGSKAAVWGAATWQGCHSAEPRQIAGGGMKETTFYWFQIWDAVQVCLWHIDISVWISERIRMWLCFCIITNL
jgi:hypothetical protein